MNYKLTTLSILVASALSVSAFGASKSKIRLGDVEPEKSPWSFSYFSENAAKASETDKIGSYNMFSLNYALNANNTLTFIEVAQFNWGTSGVSQGDVALQWAGTHDSLPGDIGVSSKVRLYLPTSSASDELGTFQMRLYGKLSKTLTKEVSVFAETNPRMYAYGKHESGQTALKWKNYAGINWSPNSVVSLTSLLGHTHYNRNTGVKYAPGTPINDLEDPWDYDDSMWIYLEAGFNIASANIAFALEQERDLRNPEETSLFNEAETIYFINLSISI